MDDRDRRSGDMIRRLTNKEIAAYNPPSQFEQGQTRSQEGRRKDEIPPPISRPDRYPSYPASSEPSMPQAQWGNQHPGGGIPLMPWTIRLSAASTSFIPGKHSTLWTLEPPTALSPTATTPARAFAPRTVDFFKL
ncbi:MAG: hypothetical protein LQ348_006009 [Seirophora lacunosa]|nr:MAG: hypothetical protein LQ348_006009 [Seirophora lacunosa]